MNFKKKMCQPIAKSRIQVDCLLMTSDVLTVLILSFDAIVTSGEQKPINNQSLASVVKRWGMEVMILLKTNLFLFVQSKL